MIQKLQPVQLGLSLAKPPRLGPSDVTCLTELLQSYTTRTFNTGTVDGREHSVMVPASSSLMHARAASGMGSRGPSETNGYAITVPVAAFSSLKPTNRHTAKP